MSFLPHFPRFQLPSFTFSFFGRFFGTVPPLHPKYACAHWEVEKAERCEAGAVLALRRGCKALLRTREVTGPASPFRGCRRWYRPRSRRLWFPSSRRCQRGIIWGELPVLCVSVKGVDTPSSKGGPVLVPARYLGPWGGRTLWPQLSVTSLREAARGQLMAERILGKTLATVSLSVALASVTVKSSGCCSIPVCRYFLSSAAYGVFGLWVEPASGLADSVGFACILSFYRGIHVFTKTPKCFIYLLRKNGGSNFSSSLMLKYAILHKSPVLLFSESLNSTCSVVVVSRAIPPG